MNNMLLFIFKFAKHFRLLQDVNDHQEVKIRNQIDKDVDRKSVV